MAAPLGYRTNHLGLIKDFMNRADPLANLCSGDLADNRKNRRGSSVCGCEGRGGVVESRARHEEHDPRLT